LFRGIQSTLRSRINKEIWSLAIPNIISNISVPLLSTVDTALMGWLSPLHLGAVGLSSMIFNFLYWNFGFLRMGTTGLTAQAFGRTDLQGMMYTLWRALLLGLGIALVLFILRKPLLNLAILAFQVQPQQIEYVREYFNVRIWDVPAYLAMLTIIGWFFGMQNAVFPLILTATVNLTNMALSYYLVVYQGMEIQGVAIGTVVAQYLGCALAGFLFMMKYRAMVFRLIPAHLFDVTTFRQFLSMNRDLFLRTVLLTFVFAFFYSQSSTFGVISLAVSVVLMQFVNWMSYGIDGLAFAAESVVGKYAGAQDDATTRRSIYLLFVWGIGFAMLYAVIYGLFYTPLFGIFTDDPEVIYAGSAYRWWVVLIPLMGVASYIWDGIFLGLTASRSMRNAMILPVIIFLLTFYVFQSSMQLHALFLALSLFLFARGAIQSWMFAKKGLALH